MHEAILTAKNLTKQYGSFTALDNVDLTVNKGKTERAEELCRCVNSSTQLFASKRKQIALMASQKSPTRISDCLFATSCSEKRTM